MGGRYQGAGLDAQSNTELHCKKNLRMSVMTLTNSHWPGIIYYSSPGRVFFLVSDISDGAGKIVNLFLQCCSTLSVIGGVHIGARALLDINLIWFGNITSLSL